MGSRASHETAPYSALADVYDKIMADVEYDDWAEFILALARARGLPDGRLLDIGCGTGNATGPLHARGFEVVGVDASEAMLAVARAKLPDVTFVRGDFEGFRAGGTFAMAVSVFDALNNLLSDEAFVAAAERVRQHLVPAGLFVFDVNTPIGLRDLWEGGLAEGWADDVYYRWVHTYDPDRNVATVEAFCDTPAGSFTEVHHERGYDATMLRTLLTRAGFDEVEVLTYPDAEPAPTDADRVWVVAKRS
ncbi:MAG: methyltransferase domain-containing protein [Trueperaceae bacterium]